MTLPDPHPRTRRFGAGERILLVEDEEIVRQHIHRMLVRLGYTVLDAVDGEAAIGILRHPDLQIDLALCDVIMPRMNGVSFWTHAQRVEPTLPFLFMSGFPPDTLHQDGYPRDVPILTKPFDELELSIRVRSAIEGRVRNSGLHP
ncbi:MAG: response regulator [Gemmatimonadota bacterium]